MKNELKRGIIIPVIYLICVMQTNFLYAGIPNYLQPEKFALLPDDVPPGHMQNDITFNHAAMLLQNLLNNHFFFNEAKYHGFAGLISKHTLNQIIPMTEGEPLTSGLVFYLCYNEKNLNDTLDDEIFLAYKHATGFTSTMSVPAISNSDVFYKTKFLLKYDGEENPSIDDVKEELTKRVDADSSSNDTLLGATVKSYSDKFKNKFKAADDETRTVVECNNYTFGFIPLNELNMVRMGNYINPVELVGLRFYLGFDNTENENRIRVFFTTAYARKNLIKIEDESKPKSSNARIIERSRP